MARMSKATIAEKEKRARGAQRVAKSRAKRVGWRRVEVWMPDELADQLIVRCKSGVVTYVGADSDIPVIVEICAHAPILRFHFLNGRTTVFKMVQSSNSDWDSICKIKL